MDSKRKVVFRLAELFGGPGGLALGLKSARITNQTKDFSIEPVWANDIDCDACRTYTLNIHPNNPEAVVCAPVETIDFTNIVVNQRNGTLFKPNTLA